ncbi:MAG TPA: Mrp/NBP35 family ATP-binding protein [Acidimicrobiales bacterium]|jgi:ATP-binding protein involved in chromosome partitioning|nr:Mrp/NBP35 family ATP-binding protein [Acidimicrobiales bacterium]
MPTREQVLEALRPVQDPELHRSIVELDMVRDVGIDGGTVAVTIALTVAGCPLRAEIEQRVQAAVGPLEGVERVDVALTVMTDEQRAAVREKLHGGHAHASGSGGGAHAGHAHGPGSAAALPFADPTSKTRVLGLSSGKGGVGKSSVTVNLAIALTRLGHEVGILDADVYGFSVPKMLGIDQEPVVIDQMIVPPVGHGVKLISTGFFVPDEQPVIWRGPMLHKALEQFLTDVLWGEPDYLLVDMPPGTGDVALSMAQFMPRSEVLVVTTPQPAAQRVAQRSAHAARKVNLSVRGVIENMSWFTGDDGKRYEIFGAGGGALLAEQLGVPLLGQVPLVTALREGGDTGAPVTVTDPAGEAALAFAALAERIAAMAPARVYSPELTIR